MCYNKYRLSISIILILFFSVTVFSFTVTADEEEPLSNDNNLSILDFDGDTTEWIEIEEDIPTGTRYMLYDHYGGFWADAEKEPGSDGVGNSPPIYDNEDDDLLCWAATCSNMLEWSGWGFVDGIDNTDDIFKFYQDHVKDDGHFIDDGLAWWFNGTLEELDIGGSVEEVDHSGFWITTNPNDFIINSMNTFRMVQKICDNIMDGRVVGLGIYAMQGNGAHAVTCWGFNYDPTKDPINEPEEYYLGIWLSDSDSHSSIDNPPDSIRYYEVKKISSGSYWYMPNYGNGWIILQMTALVPYPLEDRPVADAGGPYTGNEGESVLFYATGSEDPMTVSDPEIDPLVYRWDFNGDGNWDTEWSSDDTASYLCDESFSGTVYLEVSDGRLRDMDTATFTLNNVAPTVDAGPDVVTNEGDNVKFIGSIIDPGGDDGPYISDWDFGDGSPIQHGLIVKHTFCNAGAYTVTLTVTDKDGGMGEDTLTVIVNNLPPIVDIGFDQYVEQGETVYFNGLINDPGACDTHEWEWDFGDGSSVVTDTLTPTHVYSEEGIYQVLFWAADDNGGFDSDSLSVRVAGTSFTVDAGIAQTVNQNELVEFYGSYSDVINGVKYIHWDFGDGIVIEGELFPNHRYCGHKTYTATLMITDNLNNICIDTVDITVNNVAPTVNAGADQTVFLSDPVIFDGSYSEPGCDFLTIEWDFGDGSPVVTDTLTPEHTYSSEGSYIVTLTISDGGGGVGVDTLQITALNGIPVVDAGFDQTVNEGDTVGFSGSFIDHSSESWDIYWIFGDGDWVIDTLSTTHVYSDNDFYTATLIVIDDDGNIGIDTVEINVQNVDPVISNIEIYQPNPDYILPDIHTLEFTAIFTDQGIHDTFTIEWDFGDGTSQTGTVVEHVYNNPGLYTVTLTVTDDDRGFDIYTIEINVISGQTLSEDINYYIQNDIPDDAFNKNPEIKRISLQEMLIDDPDSVINLINSGLYEQALEKLNMIRKKIDGLPKPKDWIIDPIEQTYLCNMIDDLKLYINTIN